MSNRHLVISLIGFVALSHASAGALAQPVAEFDLGYATLAQDGMVEQDVFVVNESDSGSVLRIPVENVDQHTNSMLFATTEEPPFEPMKLVPTDTYVRGEALGISLSQWLAAKGSGSYACDGDQATVKASFEDLIPNGVYTMWNFIDANPPTDPWQGLVLPLGERDGSQNKFAANADGIADFEAVVSPCPQLSGTQSTAGLAIAWHSDGRTYGFSPGALGVVSHVQLMAIFPTDADADGQ